MVPEDGTRGQVNLTISQGTMPQAVAKLARQVDRKWTRFYTLSGSPRFDRPRREASPASGPGPAFSGGPPTQMVARLEQRFEAQLETMTPAEQQQARERRQRWEELRNLTPEQRQQRLAQLASDPGVQARMQQRMIQRIKDTTPEQRADRDKQIAARRAARAAARASGGK